MSRNDRIDSKIVIPISAVEHQQLALRARVMRLRGGAMTDDARRLTDSIYGRMTQDIKKPLRKSSSSKLRAAIGATLADLVLAECDGVWTRRPMDDHSFRAQTVNRLMFRKVKAFFEESDLIEVLPGKTLKITNGVKQLWFGHTCFKMTITLIDLAAQHGISLESGALHFASNTQIRNERD